ncbi:MAG: hypothetical protein J6U33_02030 [Paludibacteraceae bacterium]|nr:hypothetical protein [Paludibacteraceae bacterium]
MGNISIEGDDETVLYILENLSDDEKERISKQAVERTLDCMCDYYYESEIIADNGKEEVEIDEDQLMDYLLKNFNTYAINLDEDDIQRILDIEFDYWQSKGMYK